MGNLLTYGGLTTKIKAMKSRLIQDEQFREMAGLDSVTSAVDFLKVLPSYSHILKGAESGELHRGQIEQLLLQAMYYDFSKLYRFTNLSQRKFMDLYFMHFEITILKRCLRSIIGHQPLEVDLSQFADFFSRHSKVDLIRLSASRNLTEFTANLTGSPYNPMLVHLNNQEHMTLFDYEMNLDLIYFKTMWKVKDKHLKKSEREAISQCFGEKLDMLNIQWIYRSLKYYHMEPAQILALLIPIQYRLRVEQIRSMAEAGNLEEFFQILGTTYYGSLPVTDISTQPNPELLSEEILERVYRMTAQKDPYSIAMVNSYFYFKEREIQRIINIIESIRYGLTQAQILASVMNVT